MCYIMTANGFTMFSPDEVAGEILASYLEEYYGDKYNVINING